MTSLTKWGGASALAIAASYIFGFAMFLGVIDRTGYEGGAGNIDFVIDQHAMLSLAITVLYPLAAVALCLLVVAIRRAIPDSGWSEVAAMFGAIWAALLFASGFVGLTGMQSVVSLATDAPDIAQSTWAAVASVQDALGGGIELVGGLWMALVSWLAMRCGIASRALGGTGILVGAVGCVTVIPGLGDLVDLFGLGQIVWFCWIGTVLLRLPARAN
ncbi:hypothetical protein NAP1_11748 [Erythrobacter sp. NAP1]|uniref:hypothetical protein n=1 Tax=Erythrobacter sp. NAP1 TaxID=237727 RepID=UPI000068793C|nr:hypothetical protein [Erythrobacter sp. NAP1]EAQ28267.1 hypothetical protein NAP1_11748 [Erythrobacter sp. NAP1]